MLPRAEGSWCFVTSVVPAHVQAHGRQHDGLCAVASSDGGDGCKFAITCDSMRESRNILGIMVHRGPPGARRLVVPLPLPGRSPTRLGSEGPSGSVPTSGTSGTWKLVPGLGMAPYVYRHHGTVAEIDVRLIGIPARRGNAHGRRGGSRRGLYGTVP